MVGDVSLDVNDDAGAQPSTVVSLAEVGQDVDEADDEEENDDETPGSNVPVADMAGPEPEEEAAAAMPTPAASKRGGRESGVAPRSATLARTPVKTPHSAKAASTTKTTASTRRKRKADEDLPAPAPKRTADGRAAAASAQEAIATDASSRKRGGAKTVAVSQYALGHAVSTHTFLTY